MIEEMADSYYKPNVKATDEPRGGVKLKDLLSLPMDDFTQAITEQRNLIDKTDGKLGFTLLFLCVQSQLDQQAKLLLDRGANPNKQNRYGETPLHLAIEKLNHKMVNLLLEKQANPNIQQEYGETAMHFAARKGDYKVLKLLLLYKGDPFIRSNDGSLPIDFAREYCNDKCIEILEMEKQKERNRPLLSPRHNEEVKANGLIQPASKFGNKSEANNRRRAFEEYDYMQYPPAELLSKKHPYGSKSFNVNSVSKFSDNIKENGNNKINLRKSLIMVDANQRYDKGTGENSSQTPRRYKPRHKEDNFDFFAAKPKMVLHSKRNDIKMQTYQRGNTLRASLTCNVLRNSIKVAKSYFEETINARDSNPFDCPFVLKANQELFNMLKQIGMEKYTDLLVNEGFDDAKLFIHETKYVNDSHLRQIGIMLPGHRAKILIKVEMESKRLELKINNEAVFHTASDPATYNSDLYLYSLRHWLKNNKLEEYYMKFFDMGYHSIELLFFQMLTSNPLSEATLKNEFHIEKLGHRIRILNQLNDDAQIYAAKLRLNDCTKLETESPKKKNLCTCFIV